MSVAAIKTLIISLAMVFNVRAPLALEICQLEADFNPAAVGDEGKAQGLWQWHLASWEHVRGKMGRPLMDERLDPVESTLTAMYAMSELDLYRWWKTYPIAMRNLGKETK